MRPTTAHLSTSFPGPSEQWDDVSHSLGADLRYQPL